MEVIARTGRDDLATVFIARFDGERYIEFVQSVEPPHPKLKKWVLIVSTLFGCPVQCKFCNCSGFYRGKLSKEQILQQIDYLITSEFPDRIVPVEKFKIQFARMGKPSMNDSVLDVIEELPRIYEAPGLIPSISTIAPTGKEDFFDRLADIKNNLFKEKFQLQFSIHSTDQSKRDWLIPCKKWDFRQIADYGESFYKEGDRKITLNFALDKEYDIDSEVLIRYFNPEIFLIKITPVNPTIKAEANSISSFHNADDRLLYLKDELNGKGYRVIISIGEKEENKIGSNCGMYLQNYLQSQGKCDRSYTYPINPENVLR